MRRQPDKTNTLSYARRIYLSSVTIATRARRVARLLEATGCKVVFAESCTGGLVSGALTQIPGISNYHCGGVVVYRNETKRAYLNIPAKLLHDPGPVSAEVAELMAQRVLKKTPEADVGVSVTGHLGPNAPAGLDGRIYAAVAWRPSGRKGSAMPIMRQYQCRRGDLRIVRQRWVVEQVLRLLGDELEAVLKP
jgi:nicotinamide-nucleotide amidase